MRKKSAEETNRRRFLRTGLTATAVGLAGCTGNKDAVLATVGGNSALSSNVGSPKEGNHWWAHHNMTSSQYQNKFETYVSQEELRLVDVSGYGVDGEARYAAIWADVAGPKWVAHHGLTPAQYEDKFNQYTSNGYRATVFSAYSVGGEPQFAGMWEQYTGPKWYLYFDMTFSEYQSRYENLLDRGFRPTDVTGYTVNGDARYAAIWQQFDGPEWYSHHGLTSSEYQSQFENYQTDGLRITDVGGFEINERVQYVATWQKFAGPEWYSHHGMTGSELQNKFDDYVSRGFRITDVSGYTVNGKPRFAAIWRHEKPRQPGFGGIDDTITSYMREYGVPGLSIAITKDERLVFAKGYGYANREARQRMRPRHLLRIASISKPITGIAILRLMENNELALDDQVFGSDGILGKTYGMPTHGYTNGGGSARITVHHLLQHSSGWTNNGGDPMFMHPEKTQTELIRWVLSNRPLQYEPGTSNKYLNFGYCLLGRVIEAVSEKPYEQYVKDAVLRSAGVEDMVIAGNTRPERRTDEAVYYGGTPYEIDVARMDAHGGWIASPTDLLRLTVHVDGFSQKVDILGAATLDELSDREGNRQGYGEGWVLGSGWRGHSGAFDGAIGVLVRRDDGVSYAALANTRPSGDRSAGTLRTRLDNLVSDIGNWPSHDLF